jgi:hypothetical protein
MDKHTICVLVVAILSLHLACSLSLARGKYLSFKLKSFIHALSCPHNFKCFHVSMCLHCLSFIFLSDLLFFVNQSYLVMA